MKKISLFLFIFLSSFNGIAQFTFEKTFSPSPAQYGIKIFNTPNKGFLILGTLNKNYINTYIVKTDSVGDTLWTKTYGNDTIQYFPYDMCSLPDGGYLITGDYQVDTVYSMDTYIQKIDSAGNEVWFNIIGLQNYQGGSKDHGEWVRTLDDGTIIVAGTGHDGFWGLNMHSNNGVWSPFLSKLDANGNLLDKWSVFAKIPYTGGRTFDMETIGNKIYWLGESGGNTFDLGVFDENLDTVFTLNNTLTGYYWLSATSDKCLLLFGQGKIAKMDTLGNILWSQTNSSVSWPYDMIELTNGDFVSIGMERLIYTFTGFFVGNIDVYLNKYSSTGILTGSTIFGLSAGTNRHLGYSIVNTPDNGFAFAGYKNDDIWLAKIDSINTIATFLNENDIDNKTVNILPNPANSFAVISSKKIISKLRIYNSTGGIILEKEVNEKSINLDLQDYPKGLLIVELVNNDQSKSYKRLIVY